MLKLLAIFILYYVIYRFCLVSSKSDDKELEDKLFIEIYKDKKDI